MIRDIAIEQLDIHPQNVRKVYTDIDELAESIKARGVMQNLTVVPTPDKKDHYLVVIGNRRLTAARKAGLKTMPCSVVEMTEKEQISTMLLENMQRSDLSVSEQAQGLRYSFFCSISSHFCIIITSRPSPVFQYGFLS